MSAGAFCFGPCHGIICFALLNKSWLYTRDLILTTSLPPHILESTLAQMIEIGIVDHDPLLERFKLSRKVLKLGLAPEDKAEED